MTSTRFALAGLIAALFLTSAAPAPAQPLYAQETTDRYFHVKFDVARNRKGPIVEGYVYNHGPQAAQRVRLEIQRVDTAGNVVGSSSMWVIADGSSRVLQRLGPRGRELPRPSRLVRLGL